MSITRQGFLVVLKSPEEQKETADPRYKGIYRMPPHFLPPVPEDWKDEEEAMDKYIFDDRFNDDDEIGFIPNLKNAKILLQMFSKSKREFEIIFCKTAESDNEMPPDFNVEELGYDVAENMAPFWSIVSEIDNDLGEYQDSLNENGLFNSYKEAQNFLNFYVKNQLDDWDSDFEIWKIYRLINDNKMNCRSSKLS